MSVLLPSLRGAWGSYRPSPPNIGNRVFWWDAAGNAGGTFIDTGATVPATDNTRIGAIRGAEGTVLTQSDITDAPLYRLNQQNALPGVYFDATRGEHLIAAQPFITALQALTTMTVLIVWKPAPYTDRSIFRFTRATDRGLRIGTDNADKIIAYRKGDASNNEEAIIDNAANFNAAGAALFTYSGFGSTMRLDDSRSGSDSVNADDAEGTAWNKGVIGAGVSPTGTFHNYYQGYLFEIVVWDAAADGTQRTAALAYATSKWGLT